ncbi:MAG: class I SAM-dependent methyltransferase [Steroidobacteraceae bacterium]
MAAVSGIAGSNHNTSFVDHRLRRRIPPYRLRRPTTVALAPSQLPGYRLLDRLLSRQARRAAKRDFLFDVLPRGGVVIEVGVFDGDFSERILALNEPRKLHLVDPWFTKADGTLFDGPTQQFNSADQASATLEAQYQHVTGRFAAEIAAGRIEIHRTLSHLAAPQFPDEHFDWIYVDASHFYEDVKVDLAAFWPKLKRGGYIAGDDYDRRGIWEHGVTRAVDEFVASGEPQKIRMHNHQFLLRKR